MVYAQTLKQQQTRCDNAQLCPFVKKRKTVDNFPKYLKYSGASVCLTLNPLHWRIVPQLLNQKDSIGFNYTFSFLFLTIRLWIDNGDW